MTGPAERARLAELESVIRSAWDDGDAITVRRIAAALLARLAALEAVASAARDAADPYVMITRRGSLSVLRAALRALDGTEGP